ncbi:MAG: NBR1-Ig-like domain-containing protein [Anaerolineales bacterium]|jgi:hypothetical protein
MSRFVKAIWFCSALLLLATSACGKGTPVSSGAIYTQAAETVVVQLTLTALAVPPTPTITNTPLVSETPQVTNTPLLSPTPALGTPSATLLGFATLPGSNRTSCDNFQFVTDVTYPDGMSVPAGSSFVKTWRVTNLGPCSWNKSYHLVFGWGGKGTNWNTAGPVAFPGVINPGDNMEISVTLTAPKKAGSYSAAFRLQNAKGYILAPLTIYLTVVITVQ